MSLNKISVAEVCKLGIGFTLGFLAYRFISKSHQKKSTDSSNKNKNKNSQQRGGVAFQIQKQQEQNKQQLSKLKQLQQLLIHRSNDFEVQTLPENENILTKKCLFQFFAATYDLFDGRQINEITQQSRKARRQILPDIETKYETYFRFVCTLDENIKYILEKVQKDFAIFLNLDFKKVMDSISYHVDDEEDIMKADQFRLEIVKIMSTIRQNLTNYMPLFSQPITKLQLQQILAFQIQLLKSQKQNLVSLLHKIGLQTKQEQQALPLFLTCYIEDRTWQKFKIESQQMSVSNQDMDEKLRRIFQEFKVIREQTIKQMHVAVQDDIIIEQ